MGKKTFKKSFILFLISYGIYKYFKNKDEGEIIELEKNKDNYYKWKYGNIYYTVSGHGQPILLVHNINGNSSSNDFELLKNNLSKTNKVFVIDLLGCGKSTKPHLTYTNYLYVDLISHFIDNVIKDETIVISEGISSNFVIMASKINKNIKKQILINPPKIEDTELMPLKKDEILKDLNNSIILGDILFFIKKKINEIYFKKEDFINNKNLENSRKYRYLNCNIKQTLTEINIDRLAIIENTKEYSTEVGTDYFQYGKCEIKYVNSKTSLYNGVDYDIIDKFTN